MFAMLSKLAEILDRFGTGFLAARRTAKDSDVAAAVLRCATELQDLCVRGERILVLAGELAEGSARPGAAEEFGELVERQAEAVDALRSTLGDCQALLATFDPDTHLELVPLLDVKSGLLTRWGQQAAVSRYSTTTLFFLPTQTLDRVIAIGRAHATGEGLTGDRADYLLAVTDAVRSVRSREVRDMRGGVAADHLSAVRDEIAAAGAELARVKATCGQLLAAVREAVGPEVMAHLRRTLVPRSR